MDYPPLIYREKSPIPIGLSATLIQAFAAQKGYVVDFARFDSWEENLGALRTGRIDVIAAIQASPERAKDFSFTPVYVSLPVYFIGRAGGARDPHTKGVKISCPRGSFLEAYLRKNFPTAFLVFVEDYLLAMNQVSIGEVDFAAMPMGQASFYLKEELFSKITVAGKTGFEYDFRVAVAKSNTELLEPLAEFMRTSGNRIVSEYKSEWLRAGLLPWQRFGTYAAIVLGIALIGTVALWINSLRRNSKKLSAALSQTRSFVNAIVDNMPDQVFVRDAAGFYIFANKALCQALLLPLSDIVGKHLTKIYPEEFALGEIKSDQEILKHAKTETRTQKSGRTNAWYRTTKLPIQRSDGSTTDILGIATDVTETELKSQALSESEQKWKFALEGAGDGVWEWDILSGETLYTKRWKEILGYTENEISDRAEAWESLIHPDDLKKALADIAAHLAGQTAVYVNEQRMKCKNGEFKWVLERGIIVSRDKEGNPLRMVGTQIDIQERKTAEQKLAQFRALINESHDAIYLIDPDTGRYLDCNLAGFSSLGYTQSELLNLTVKDVASHIPDQTAWRQRVMVVIASGGLVFETNYRRKDGTEFPVEVSVRMHTEGSSSVMIAVARDVTIRKNTELALRQAKKEAEIANQAKSNFLAMITHELRTPLNGVVGLANLIGLTPLNDTQRKYMDLIIASGRNLLTIINDTLDFSKIESGNMEVEMAAFNLHQTLDECIDIVQPTADHKNLRILRGYSEKHLPKMLISDANRLRQILLNLLSNAVKFTQRGEVELKVTRARANEDWVQLEFSVRDTGMGIPAEDQQKLFKPFTQADQTISRRFGGTGLGLSISARLVELLGGQLGMESIPGKGSRFHFTIQCDFTERRKSDRPSDVAAPDLVDQSFSQNFPLRILVAEDNEINQIVIAESLHQLGYLSKYVNNGRAALEAVKDDEFDLIFMDMQMPELDGLAATRWIRENLPEKNIRIVALTANAGSQDKSDCISAGMNGFLSKPFMLKELQDTLKSSFSALKANSPPT